MAGRRAGVAREISYAHAAATGPGRALIRGVENASGRLRLIRRAAGYEAEVARGRDFWEVIAGRYGLTLDIRSGSLDAVPRTGPLIMVANHPYGILDGLAMGLALSRARGPEGFRILAHRVFRRAEALERVILPVDFDEGRAAQAANIGARRDALAHLGAGGAIGIFPGGTVSTAPKPFGAPRDPMWRAFTARMVARSGAVVVPVFFEGANSRTFQLASHLHSTLRMAMLIREFRARVDAPVRMHVGAPIGRDVLDAVAGDARGMMDFLRRRTYALSPMPVPEGHGHEFEARYR